MLQKSSSSLPEGVLFLLKAHKAALYIHMCVLCLFVFAVVDSSGGEEVERRAYADVRQLEAAATATRKLGGRRKLKALPAPPVKTTAGGSAAAAAGGSGGSAAAGGGSATAGGGAVAEKMPLERSSGGSSSSGASAAQPGKGQASGGGGGEGGGGLKGFFAVSRGRQIGECSG